MLETHSWLRSSQTKHLKENPMALRWLPEGSWSLCAAKAGPLSKAMIFLGGVFCGHLWKSDPDRPSLSGFTALLSNPITLDKDQYLGLHQDRFFRPQHFFSAGKRHDLSVCVFVSFFFLFHFVSFCLIVCLFIYICLFLCLFHMLYNINMKLSL